jgi:beta-glucanase (GH16 family)
VTTPATAGCTRTKSDGEWELVLAEEFNGADGTCVSPAVWGTEKGYVRNQELQYYTDAPANLFQRGGALVIKAQNVSGNVTSASIYTKQAYTYGRFEARMKVPKGKGIWAAFWLLGIDISTLGWPWCGEVAVEYLGSSPNQAMGVIQSAEKNYARNNEPKGSATMSYPNDFTVYTIDWTPTAVTVFADGFKVARCSTTVSAASCRGPSTGRSTSS